MVAWRADDPVVEERVSAEMQAWVRVREGRCVICGTLPEFCECPSGVEDTGYQDDREEEHRV